MVAVQRGLLVLMAAGALALPSQVPVDSESAGSPVKKSAVAASAYDAGQREAYLTPDQLDYIRPGLRVTINGVTNVAAGQKPVVEFTITDDFGNPLDRTGATTVGIVTYRFIPAVWDGKYYTDQLGIGGNPTRDNTGVTQTLEVGHYKYTFAAAMPAAFDATKPATLFGGFIRNLTDTLGKNFYVQAFKDGIPPDLKTAATTYQVTTTARCNQCHDPLALHGGNYREIKTCALCHNPNNMVGTIPPSGNEGAEERSTYNGQHFWHLVHAEAWENATNITYPQDIRSCETCHDPSAPGANVWNTRPSRAACGGCHVDVNFATGAGHSDANLPQLNDNECATCHVPQGDAEYDASIKGAHTVPSDSKQLKGLNVAILDATNIGPGKKPTVTFKITENDGKAVAPNTTGLTISLQLGGTTADYFRQPISESATAAQYNASTGQATYTFTNAIPADAKGTWTFSATSRRTIALQKADGTTLSYTEGAMNPIRNVAVTGTTVTPRRVAVDLAKCNTCHDRLGNLFSHGGQRLNIQFCVMCHNPNATDANRRPADHSADPAESYQFARMIHRLHTGEELTQEYTIYDRNGNPVPFNEVTYPGDRRNCLKCHAGNNTTTFDLPMPTGTLDVVTPRDYFTPQGPGTAACLGCHDNRDAAAHAYLNTAPFGEACGTCHGTGADWAVDKVHAR
jgi:OmcA/MtrC family decaheme c-type cytochrome